ncbi:histidine kinase hamp region domain protein [Flammeovirgaceae bacterium 311]|nr:histidine kinase hamp region domain protein [Flammeovirgaceae bacterium 311]
MEKLFTSIKTKIQLSFLIFILLATLTGILSYKILNTIIAHEELKSKIDEMVTHFAEARKQEKDFILYDRKEVAFLEDGKSESLQKHIYAIGNIQQLIQQIKISEELAEEDELYEKISALASAVSAYEQTFSGLVKAYKIRGFKDHGMEGDMREVIHQLQECRSKEEQWFALMLRRHEKDFFIRHDPKYIETLHKRVQDFIAFVEDSRLPHMSTAYREKTTSAIQNYANYFDRIAAIETKIGLTKNEGFIGALNRNAEATEPLLAQVQQTINQRNQTLAGNSMLFLLISICMMVACGLGFSFLLAREISNPIIHLSQVVEQASVGDNSTLLTLDAMQRKDELGKLIVSIGHMFREINLKVEEIYQKNILLQTNAQQEKERIWVTEGISLFERIMAKQANDLNVLCDEFLFNLVKYTQSSQAVLFLKANDESGIPIMQMQSCYASNKKRYILHKSIEIGEGLAGAVWQEKEPFYMTDIPDSYSKIRSGLGQAKPTAVFIVPAVLEEEVEAIVEIGSFREYSEKEKNLIQQVCKGLANAISRVRLQEQTNHLLEKANALAEELRQNEEEMRQQLEELTATHEKYQKIM